MRPTASAMPFSQELPHTRSAQSLSSWQAFPMAMPQPAQRIISRSLRLSPKAMHCLESSPRRWDSFFKPVILLT